MNRAQWNQRYEGKQFLWTVDPNRLVLSEVATLPPGRALDLGAGEGRNAVWLSRQGWSVTAVDFSDIALARAAQLASTSECTVTWMLQDVTAFAPAAACYDLVVICYLQLPPFDRRQVIASARTALATGGTLLYVGHDASNLEHGHGGPRDPRVLCTPADIVADLPNFEILRAEVVAREVATEPGHGGPRNAIALDAVVRAVRRV